MYTIIATPNPVLVKKARAVTHFDKKLEDILSGMRETLMATTDPVGVGLAAPQVGLPLRIFQMKPYDNSPVTNFINPQILEESEGEEVSVLPNSQKIEKMKKMEKSGAPKPKKGRLLEGCLSIPNIWGNVARRKIVKLSWQDEKGKKHTKTFTGFPAVIVQHEIDHLEGILFTKHVIEQHEKLYKSHKNDKGEDEFDEVKI